ncbi:MAG: DUF2142 domain-containing protein [Elusimicrobiaceae bacterium]|nr:DUF2142 domain-containing protein [Elusimicrobiaceae bacterium]
MNPANIFGKLKLAGFSREGWLFFFAFFASGLFFAALTPPYQMPDEPAHFMRSFQLVRGDWLPRPDTPDTLFPSALEPDVKAVNYLVFKEDTRFSLPQLKTLVKNSPPLSADNFAATKRRADSDVALYFNTTAYSPVAYLPLSAGVLAARILSLKAIYALYLARLASLLCAAIFITIGFEIIKKRFSERESLLYAVAAFIPMHIALAACASTDGVTNTLAFLATAQGLAMLATADKTTGGERFAFIMTSVLLGLCKYIYLVIPFVLELAYMQRDMKKRWPGSLFLIAAALLPAAGWSMAAAGILVGKSQGQAAYVLAHPFLMLAAMGKLILSFSYLRGMIGSFGWLDAPASKFSIFAYLAAMLAAAVTFKSETGLPRKTIWAGLALLLFVILLGCYVAFTQVGLDVIVGVQGRYFLPGMALFLIAAPELVKLSERGIKILKSAVATVWLYLMYSSLYGAVWKRFWS